MKRIIVAAVAVIALAAAAPALADGKWQKFENQSLLCSISRPGGSEGVTCIVKSGDLQDWAFIAFSGGIEVYRPNDTVAFRKKTTESSAAANISWAGWPYRNEGVACKKKTYTVACMIRSGGMLGWSVLVADTLLEVTNLDGAVKFRKGSVS
jgi:hypothetical protein